MNNFVLENINDSMFGNEVNQEDERETKNCSDEKDNEISLPTMRYEHSIIFENVEDEVDCKLRVDNFDLEIPLDLLPDEAVNDMLFWCIESFRYAQVYYNKWVLKIRAQLNHYVKQDYTVNPDEEDLLKEEDDNGEALWRIY